MLIAPPGSIAGILPTDPIEDALTSNDPETIQIWSEGSAPTEPIDASRRHPLPSNVPDGSVYHATIQTAEPFSAPTYLLGKSIRRHGSVPTEPIDASRRHPLPSNVPDGSVYPDTIQMAEPFRPPTYLLGIMRRGSVPTEPIDARMHPLPPDAEDGPVYPDTIRTVSPFRVPHPIPTQSIGSSIMARGSVSTEPAGGVLNRLTDISRRNPSPYSSIPAEPIDSSRVSPPPYSVQNGPRHSHEMRFRHHRYPYNIDGAHDHNAFNYEVQRRLDSIEERMRAVENTMRDTDQRLEANGLAITSLQELVDSAHNCCRGFARYASRELKRLGEKAGVAATSIGYLWKRVSKREEAAQRSQFTMTQQSAQGEQRSMTQPEMATDQATSTSNVLPSGSDEILGAIETTEGWHADFEDDVEQEVLEAGQRLSELGVW